MTTNPTDYTRGMVRSYEVMRRQPPARRHSPAPWRVSGQYILDATSQGIVAVLYTPARDAALVAAAPELLAVCRQALEYLDDILVIDEEDAGAPDRFRQALHAVLARVDDGAG